ncbi:MAG: ATP synthase F1 subunit epsilon [Abditibacteriaceae bacterium]
MSATYNLQIVTPEREIYNASVESIRLPGTDGSFGVLRNHAPIVAALDAGIVYMIDGEIHHRSLVIGGGFFQMANNKAILLADSALFANEINREAAEEEERQARSKLEEEMGPEFAAQRDAAAQALKLAQIKQRASSTTSRQ